MTNLIQSAEHAIAIAANDTVKAARFLEGKVLPALKTAQANEATIEAVTGLVSTQAANIERLAFAGLGVLIKGIEDASAAGAAGGVNISLDAALVADIKAIIPALKAQSAMTAAAVPVKA